MAENKKSVLLYCDIIHTVNKLTDGQAGILFKHYLNYINDLNPTPPDQLTEIVFEPIKQNLKRDLKKWEKFIEKQSVNGSMGGRPKNPSLSKKTQAFYEIPKKAVKVIVTDIVNVKDKVTDIEKKKEAFKNALSHFLDKYGKEMLNSFWMHWAQPNKSNTKIKWELEKTWDLGMRLSTWASREKNFGQKEPKRNTVEAMINTHGSVQKMIDNDPAYND